MNKGTISRVAQADYLFAAFLAVIIVGVPIVIGGSELAILAILSLMVVGVFIWILSPFPGLDSTEIAMDPWQDIYRAPRREQQSKAGCPCDVS